MQELKAKRAAIGFGSRRVQPEEFALFNQEFMALIRAGLTIPDALALAANRPDSPNLGRILARVLEDVRGGVLLSDACAHHPEAFERLYLAAVRTGEKTGDLAKVLARYHEYLRHRVALRKKLNQAMAYPAFLLVALAVILAVLFVFVMPRFVAMYADLGADLPLPTRMLLGVVEYIYIVAPLVVAAVAAGVVGWRRWTATATGRRQVDQIRERLPYVGGLVRIVIAAQLARSLSTLLSGGTPLVEALQTAASSVTNQVYLDRLEQVTRQVIEGGSLAQAVRATALMPDMAARMIEVGEASGGLDTMLAEIAQFYEEMLDTWLSRVMTLVEPLMMLLMGVLIGGIIIIMYLPVFHLADIIK
ncbi:MAG: type II secretion system F family protein [Candidatus Moduliflexus flocculans]|nr:type II secretion system F family protein [Candidatus Moduliflexus flocculans]